MVKSYHKVLDICSSYISNLKPRGSFLVYSSGKGFVVEIYNTDKPVRHSDSNTSLWLVGKLSIQGRKVFIEKVGYGEFRKYISKELRKDGVKVKKFKLSIDYLTKNINPKKS